MAIPLPKVPKVNDVFKKNLFSVGLDIGSTSVKICRIEFSKDKTSLIEYKIIPVQINPAEVLKQASQEVELRIANASISGPSTIIRYVDFPKMSLDDLRKALKFEAQKFIPFSVADVNLDASILKQDTGSGKMLIAVVAVKKDFLNQKMKILNESEFKAHIIDVDSLALINAFNFNYPKNDPGRPKSLALLNIGASLSNLNILEEEIPLLSRDISIAGNNVTQKIMEAFGIDAKAAEALKINPDKDRMQKIITSTESIISSLATEIRVSFDYYESQSASSVEKIYLSGGGSLLLGLKDSLSNLLDIPVEFWDPLKRINLSPDIEIQKVKSLASELGVAVGLALRV